MKWTEWQPFYDEIVEQLDIDPTQDYKATEILNQILIDIEPTPLISKLESTIRNRDVVVFGSGPSLEKHLVKITSNPLLSDAVFVAADGATSALVESGLRCDFIITDLDGDMEDIQSAINDGALPVVHAHGDNISLVTKYVPQMDSVLGSTQVEPLPNVFLWGGFTDGDRACYLVSHYSPARIILAGMDFGKTVGRWSKPGHTSSFSASPRKLIKLGIAQDLLSRLWQTTGIPHLRL
ncbi:MAG: 6-hydroxymethylpterin diphosphokinase MptE-like protein [Candidatus Thorarchaeota archaeon]